MPFSPHEDRSVNKERRGPALEWRAVPMSHQVSNQPPLSIGGLFRVHCWSTQSRYPSGPDNRQVAAHLLNATNGDVADELHDSFLGVVGRGRGNVMDDVSDDAE